MDIGKLMKARRIELEISADEVARKIGKSKATIYRYENGDIEKMPISILEPLAKVLQTTPAELMGFTDIVQLSKEESKIIMDYRSMNSQGQEKLLEYSDDLISSKKYEKCDTISNMKK